MFRFSLMMLGLMLVSCLEGTNLQVVDSRIQAKWISIPGQCFDMGETRVYRDEGPVTNVCVSPFEIWSHEISNAEYTAFIEATNFQTRAELGWNSEDLNGPEVDVAPGSAVFSPPKNPKNLNWWKFVDGASWKYPFGPEENKHLLSNAVVHLTRQDAEAYAQWAGGRLPTEAEWELAARGGLNGQLMSWSDAENAALEDKANTWQGVFPLINSQEDGYAGVAPVGTYPPNGFGLYDMIGNVWEWTSSTYYPSHRPGEVKEFYPDGYAHSQDDIPLGVIKGGSFLCARSYCYRYRPAARHPQDLSLGTSHIGFRIVRDIPN